LKFFPLFASLALLATLYCPIPLLYFSPLLVWVSYRAPLTISLWIALGCGLVIDLLGTHTLFPLNALAYCLVTLLIYRLNRHFFEDQLFTLPLLTLIASLTITLIQLPFVTRPPLTWQWALTDLMLLPLGDALIPALLPKGKWAILKVWQK